MTWRELGRQVRRGEKGLAIPAPVVRLVESDDGTEERRVVGFRPVHVFDISSTEGPPLPEVTPVLLDGDLPECWDQVADLITDRHVSDWKWPKIRLCWVRPTVSPTWCDVTP